MISLIVAHDLQRGIGYHGKMPWYLPCDLQRFKKLTMGSPVVMGRKNFCKPQTPLAGPKKYRAQQTGRLPP